MEAILAAIFAFFVFPGIGFWLGIGFLSVVYTIATESDSHGFAIFSTILGAILFWKTIALGFAVWPLLLLALVGYAVIGGVWSVYRWFRYCRQYIFENPFDKENVWDYKDGQKVRLTATEHFKKKLRPSEHKSRLIGWIVYWPWLVIWNIVGDVVTGIYEALTNVYQKTADSVIKKIVTTN